MVSSSPMWLMSSISMVHTVNTAMPTAIDSMVCSSMKAGKLTDAIVMRGCFFLSSDIILGIIKPMLP